MESDKTGVVSIVMGLCLKSYKELGMLSSVKINKQ